MANDIAPTGSETDTDEIDSKLYEAIVRRTEPMADGTQNANGALFTGQSRLKQEASKGNVPCDRDEVGDAVNRLLGQERIVSWHGILAPATDDHLRAIIENEQQCDIPRNLFIKKCEGLLDSSAAN